MNNYANQLYDINILYVLEMQCVFFLTAVLFRNHCNVSDDHIKVSICKLVHISEVILHVRL